MFDPRTRRQIPLAKTLRKQGVLDQTVCLGDEARLSVRLVAVPISDAVANMRRRKLRQNLDRKLPPSPEHLFLLGWNIFITDVGPDLWPARHLQSIYRLHWRIETLFKAWKSHLALCDLNDRCLPMAHLAVMTKLIFFAFVYRTCHHLETVFGNARRHVSILRLAKLLSPLPLFLKAAFVNLSPQQLLVQLTARHAFCEPRRDRPHFQNILLAVQSPLG